jgi:hypothetical protein
MVMTDDRGHANTDRTSLLAHAATIKEYVWTFITALAAVVGIAFVGGQIWSRVVTYDRKVDNLRSEVDNFKVNLNTLGDPQYTYETDAQRCEIGNIVVGLRHDGERTIIRCASLARAIWNQSECKVSCPTK